MPGNETLDVKKIDVGSAKIRLKPQTVRFFDSRYKSCCNVLGEFSAVEDRTPWL
jgi:hypothetical protein